MREAQSCANLGSIVCTTNHGLTAQSSDCSCANHRPGAGIARAQIIGLTENELITSNVKRCMYWYHDDMRLHKLKAYGAQIRYTRHRAQ